MSAVVHAAPYGVTKEWFNTIEHPSFPCGAVTAEDAAGYASWKPRLWQVTCEECRKAVEARGPFTITPGPVIAGPVTRMYPEDIRALGRTFGPPLAPRGVWSGG